MNDTLIPQMIENSLRVASAELDTCKKLPLSPVIANEFFHVGLLMTDLAERQWEFLRDRLTLGMDNRKLIEESRVVEQMLAGIARNTGEILRILQAPELPDMPQQRLDRLSERHTLAVQLAEKASALRVWAETPMPPIDPASIPRKGNPLTGEGYRSADVILEEWRQKQEK